MVSMEASSPNSVTGSANHGPSLSIVCWLLLVISTLLTISRLATKWAVSKRFNSADALATGALVSNIGSGMAASVAAINGLGKNFVTLGQSHIIAFEKSTYSSNLLYITTLCFTKLSIIMLLRSITPQRVYRHLEFGLGVTITISSAVFLLAASFPCQRPRVWSNVGQKCYDRGAFWQAYGAVEIIANLALILLPFHIVKDLQMSWAKKAIVLGCFGIRFFDIAAIATQIAYSDAFDGPNRTFGLWPWFLIAQLVQTLSILSSCVPYLRPLFEALNSGMFLSDELRRRGESLVDSGSLQECLNKRYILRKPMKVHESSGFASPRGMTGQTMPEAGACGSSAASKALVRLDNGTVERSDEITGDTWDAESQESRSRIIKGSTAMGHEPEGQKRLVTG